MFIEFLRTQTTAQATQATHASHAKSERSPNPEIFSGERSSIEYIYEHLEFFGIALDLKMTLKFKTKFLPRVVKHSNTPVAALSKRNRKSCDRTIPGLCGHMTRLLLT